jgi:hypothetical protein
MRDSSGAEFLGEPRAYKLSRFSTLLLQHCVSPYTQITYCPQQGSNLRPYDPKSQNVLPVSADWSASVQDVRPLPDRRGLNRDAPNESAGIPYIKPGLAFNCFAGVLVGLDGAEIDRRFEFTDRFKPHRKISPKRSNEQFDRT